MSDLLTVEILTRGGVLIGICPGWTMVPVAHVSEEFVRKTLLHHVSRAIDFRPSRGEIWLPAGRGKIVVEFLEARTVECTVDDELRCNSGTGIDIVKLADRDQLSVASRLILAEFQRVIGAHG